MTNLDNSLLSKLPLVHDSILIQSLTFKNDPIAFKELSLYNNKA